MKNKKTLEDDISTFLEVWDCKRLCAFLNNIIPLFELYNVDDENDWVKDAVGEDQQQNIRLIRTVYLMSKIADSHGAEFIRISAQYKKLWQRMEREVLCE